MVIPAHNNCDCDNDNDMDHARKNGNHIDNGDENGIVSGNDNRPFS